jgi:hypothetical protein
MLKLAVGDVRSSTGLLPLPAWRTLQGATSTEGTMRADAIEQAIKELRAACFVLQSIWRALQQVFQ